MFNPKKRGFLVKAAAVLTAVALTVGASPSHAQTTVTDMPTSSDVVITKLDQTDVVGGAADGTVQNPGGSPIGGVTFEAYKVPLTETEGTEEWQQEIARTSVSTANQAVNDADPAIEPLTDTTNTDGVITWNGVPRGLYLVRETATPPGVVASPDFLLAVPLTNPDDLNAWLEKIYVYPKNSEVSGTKTVVNEDSLVTDPNVGKDGDTGDLIPTTPVTWTINAEIPKIGGPGNAFVATDHFEIRDTLKDSELSLVDGVNSVNVTHPTTLSTEDYEIKLDKDTESKTTTVVITFTSTGLANLADALPGESQVTVTLDTLVNTVGEIENAATVYPSLREDSTYKIKPATVKYGNITLKKLSTQEEPNLAGAQFRVYSDLTAAQDKTDAYLTTASKTDGLWTTDADGEIEISGLRYSYFANGEVANEGPLVQKYWLVETKALEGHQLLAEPIEFEVTSDDGSNVVSVTNSANTNGFTLPLTGGTGTALLTLLGVILLGVVLFVARTRRNSEAA